MVIIILSGWRKPQEVLGRNEALVGWVPACFYATKRYDTTKTPGSKQSDGKYIKFLCAGGIFILTEEFEKS